ncbi:MAG: HAD-IC family P-type ATPase, partial [Phycisphaeraceae bacterium]
QDAGIRVIMVTGDQPETGQAIGEAVGIFSDHEVTAMHGRDLHPPEELSEAQREQIHHTDIFARVSPEQKLDLIRVLQDRGETVAMTGDGINDAPALKKADIGIAMGLRGTEAARQVADMVLTDDAFASIVAAVKQGRIIFGNIRKSVMFMLCTNVAEVLAVTVATLAGMPLPLRPLQILYLNVITDVFPALALGVGKAAPGIMKRPPRDPRESVLTRYHWGEIAGWSTLISACVLGGLAIAQQWLAMSELEAVTVSFLTLAFGKLWFTFVLRNPQSGLVFNEITENPWVWGAIALCAALLLAAVYLPGLSTLLETRQLSGAGWGLVLGLSLVPLIVGQTVRLVQGWRGSLG